MLERGWIAMALVLSALAGVAGYAVMVGGAVGGAGMAGGVAAGGVAALSAGLTLAAVTAFALIVLARAVVDGRVTGLVTARLARMARAGRRGEPVGKAAFLRAFEGTYFAGAATDFAATVQAPLGSGPGGGPSGKAPHGTPPPEAHFSPEVYFTPGALIEERLLAVPFRHVPAALYALGAALAVAALAEGAAGFTAGAGPASLGALAGSARDALTALLFPLAAGPLMGLTQRILVDTRRRQLRRLWRAVAALFPRAITVPGQTEAALSKAMTVAMGAALADPLARLTEASAGLAGDQGAAVREAMRQGAAAFLSELETNFGDRLADTNQVLGTTAGLVADLRDAFTEMAATLRNEAGRRTKTLRADLRRALKAQEAENSRAEEALISRLEAAIAGLDHEVAAHGAHLDALTRGLLDGLDKIAAPPPGAEGEALAAVTGGLNAVRGAVEGSIGSLAPLLQQVAEGQARLVAIVERESQGMERIAGLVSELSASARANRETAERFTALAQSLGGQDRPARAPGAQAATHLRPVAGREESSQTDLVKAVRALQQETEITTKKLPKL